MTQKNLNNQLLDACSEGDLEKVQTSLQRGANLNYQGGRALEEAVREGHLEVAKALLDEGIRIKDKYRFSYLIQLAHDDGHQEIVELLNLHQFQRSVRGFFYVFGGPGRWVCQKIESYGPAKIQALVLFIGVGLVIYFLSVFVYFLTH